MSPVNKNMKGSGLEPAAPRLANMGEHAAEIPDSKLPRQESLADLGVDLPVTVGEPADAKSFIRQGMIVFTEQLKQLGVATQPAALAAAGLHLPSNLYPGNLGMIAQRLSRAGVIVRVQGLERAPQNAAHRRPVQRWRLSAEFLAGKVRP